MPTIDPTEDDEEDMEEAILNQKRRNSKYGEEFIEEGDE